MPEFLGGTFSFNYTSVNETPQHQTPHITAKQEPGTFVLKISETELSDTGLYDCPRTRCYCCYSRTPSSDPVRPGDSVTLQFSVLSDSESKSCPTDHSVYWFRAGSDESHPSLIYFHGNSSYQCEKSPEPLSSQSCVYHFSKNVSSSDVGTYYCAVATCGQILFGNGTKLDTESLRTHSMWDLQTTNTVLLLLCTTLAISLIIIAFLIYIIKKKTCSRNAAVSLETDAETVGGNQESQQIDKDSLAYSAPTFIRRKEADRTERKKATRAEEETLYSDIRAVVRK
ncbi:uncharacterized protein LOC113160953 [Anabas testudineus]|uniref:uncharacterized protein LOC113160953 n=1 Tax=Anabas testudineus TaxID=64144 RepID=UPI000E4573BB|nr:uncharacterized protein LOC113160953 [Anabas testudineus]